MSYTQFCQKIIFGIIFQDLPIYMMKLTGKFLDVVKIAKLVSGVGIVIH